MARTRQAPKRKCSEQDTDDEFEEDNDSPHEKEGVKVMVNKKSCNSKLGDWFIDDNVFILKHNQFKADQTGNKIASFDFDSTLVETKSGKPFTTNPTDWKMWHEKVPQKLKQLHKDGYKLVIFTNQGGIEKKKLTVKDVIERVEAFIEAAVGTDIPVLVLAAPSSNHYRKPATGMWDRMVKDFFGGDESRIDMKSCIYVGDAAGRPKNWEKNKKKDHSCSDRKFASNVGIDFKTPEEFFLEQKPFKDWKLDVLDVKEFFKNLKKPYQTKDVIDTDRQELVLFTGFPASGKSTFYKKHFEPNDYVHVNRDLLKTPAKCLKAAEEALSKGKSVVVDNTNPDRASRKEYLDIARKAKVRARCFVFDTPREVADHLNLLREKITKGESKHVPAVGYNVYKKKKEDVTTKEGWDEVKIIEFIPDFVDDEARKRFFEYT